MKIRHDGIEIELSTDADREEKQAYTLMKKAVISCIEGEWNSGLHSQIMVWCLCGTMAIVLPLYTIIEMCRE